MRKNSFLTVTDQFCGAGGSSQGIRNLSKAMKGGVEVRLALNHWQLAIETHNTNFPDTDHDCTDISACDPRRYPSTDILITSPECTNHSLAKGRRKTISLFDKIDPAEERSRATMWDVCRFSELHSYNIIIVENVVDARKWVMWDAWIKAMQLLGYNHKCVYFNSMHFHPTPQSRDRLYVVFWKKGNKAPDLDYRPLSYCHKCVKNISAWQSWKNILKPFGKYRTQYVYRCPDCNTTTEPYYYAAYNCIDWTDYGTRIGDRKKALSPKSIERIEFGLDKYGNEPFQVLNYHGTCFPFIVDNKQTTGIGFRIRHITDKLPTIHTEPALNLITPFIIKSEHSHGAASGKLRAVDREMQTQTTRQSMALVVPWIIEMNRTGECKPASEPASTITSGGINHAVLQSFIGYYYSQYQASHPTDALGTAKTHDTHFLINYEKPRIEDCYYRMLKAEEIKLAMAFDKDYIVLGSSKNKVKQCGNAVTPPVMEWISGQCIKSLQ